MEKIPGSFFGYKKQVVDDMIKERDNKLKTQQKDINYLRKELINEKKKTKVTTRIDKNKV